jgi:hypothetical protein
MPPAVPVPRWMGVGLCGALSIVVGFGLSGLVLAVLGLFFPILVVPLGAVVSFALFRCAQPQRLEHPASRADTFPALGALAVAFGSLWVNLTHSAQHLLIDRDPGAYINTGRWLATHSGLVFRADSGPFATMTGLTYSSPAVYGHGPRMHFQFSHLEGVLLAEARWLGGDHLMFALTPIIGAVSIVMFYALVCRFVRPVLALLATVALSVEVVQLHFSRDASSEIVLQLVLLGSLWVLGLPGLGGRRALFAGVLLGTCVAGRIDGPLYLAAVPVLVGIAASRRATPIDTIDDGIRPDVAKWFALGAGTVAVLGIVDVSWRVPEYVRLQGWRVAAEYAGLIGLTVLAVWLGRRAERWKGVFARRPRLPTVVGAAFAFVLFAMWLARPYLQHPRGRASNFIRELQIAQHLTVDPGRKYFQNSLRWHAWYLGPAALAAGIVGSGVFLRDTIRRGTVAMWALASCFAVVAGVYLYNASITPDHLWAMRRFVPIVIPGLLLFAVIVVERLLRRSHPLGLLTGVALAVLLVAWPLSATWPVRSERTQPGMLDAVTATCGALGRDAAVVVLPGESQLYRQIPQVLRGFCNVPVAIRTDDFTAGDLETLARRWRAEGRVLHVFADDPQRITELFPSAMPRTVAMPKNDRLLVQTLDRPPRGYMTRVDSFVIATVPVPAELRPA